jgi:NMD protein affecting ribosome stability and mRNA decay
MKCPRCGIKVPEMPEDATEEEMLCNLCYEKNEKEESMTPIEIMIDGGWPER